MPKCKVCGTRLAESAKFCGNCGAKQEETQNQTAYQTRAQTQQKPNMGYQPVQPAPKKKPALGKIVGGIVGATVLVGIIFAVIDAAGGSSSETSYSQPQQQKAAYAKIECEFAKKVDDTEWNFWGLYFASQTEVLEQHELTQADKNAIQYAINYIEKNMQPLEKNGIYKVMLYKDYYNEDDNNGWFMCLRYNRTIEDFDIIIGRF